MYPWLAFEALEIIPCSFDFCPECVDVKSEPTCEVKLTSEYALAVILFPLNVTCMPLISVVKLVVDPTTVSVPPTFLTKSIL